LTFKDFIYLDYNATTPCDPRVVEAMLPWFYENPGNAASRTHPVGWKAEEAVKVARERLANLISVKPKEIVFTSGATESNNLALKGIYERYISKGNHIVTLTTEHKAVLDPLKKLEKAGAEVTYLEVEKDGRVDLEKMKNALTEKTILVAVMWANNETGVIQDMEAIGKICAEKKVFLFSDATQAVGKISVDPKKAGVHLMAFSGHKMYAPKGIGALYISGESPKMRLTEQINGGGHEGGFRSGTLNVPSIVGFGKAAEIAAAEMSERIAVASGSACTSASLDPSHVLLGMGLSKHLGQASLRFSLGKWTTEAEIDETIEMVIAGVNHLRATSPIWELYKDGVDVDAFL